MYFWNIERLKSDLVVGPLSERQIFPYFIIFIGLSTATAYFSEGVSGTWDWIDAISSLTITVFGTFYIYRRNGGGHGRHFLQRYFAIGWVVSIRWIVFCVGALIPFAIALVACGIKTTEGTQWYEVAFLALAMVLLYWRIGHHVVSVTPSTIRSELTEAS